MHRIASLIAGITGIALTVGASAADIDWGKVDQALGKPGTSQPGGVHKYGLPRTDLKITLDGVAIKPTLALGSWIGFLPTGDGAMFMGDLSQTPFAAPAPAQPPATLDMDTAAIDTALGAKGTVNGGVYQFNIPRAESISEDGMAVPPSMGTAIAINFQPTGSRKAAITGDFVLLGKEVNPVLKALRNSGIEVTALHSHMIDDSPHLFFMHFWANDDVTRLSHGLRAALDLANVKRGS